MNKKIITYIILALIIIIALIYIFTADFSPKKTTWGVTFSQQYAQYELGLDWQKTYTAILDDLKVDHIRLSAYWNYNEPTQGQYNFSDLDWQIDQASARGTQIILAVGRKLPRWPECHDPLWIKDLPTDQIQKQQLNYITTVINKYKDNKNIIAWQIENEPFLGGFGFCPLLDKGFLNREIELVKSLSDKPTMITDSGELSSWMPAGKTNADILGSTLYRVVYNPIIGYIHWPVPPFIYYAKTKIVKALTHKQKIIVAELQAESWHKANVNLEQMTQQDHDKSMSLKQLQKNINFSQRAGFDEVYLWGAEWWYLMKEQKGNPTYWDEAKKLWH